MKADVDGLKDPNRLSDLDRTGLLDSPVDEIFDRLTRTAAELLDIPVSLISLVTDERQFFKSQTGLPEPYAQARQTPLSHSFCQHVVTSRARLVIRDATEADLVKDNLAIRDINVIAYLGIPLEMPNGSILGAFCAIDGKPRDWSERDIKILDALAGATIAEISLRLELAQRQKAEQELVERQAELDRTNEKLKRFTGAVAHDLNAPLRRISVNIDLIEADFGDQISTEMKSSLKNLQSQARNARKLIDAFLNYYRDTSPPDKLEKVPLLPLAQSVADLMTETHADASPRFHFPTELPPILGEWRLVGQVLLNLFSNAIKFRRHETPEIRLVQNGDASSGMIRIDISDNGTGVDPRESERIFTAFTRLHPDNVPGHGLGLSLARDIMEIFGGRIWLDHSEPGSSRFSLEFKAA